MTRASKKPDRVNQLIIVVWVAIALALFLTPIIGGIIDPY